MTCPPPRACAGLLLLCGCLVSSLRAVEAGGSLRLDPARINAAAEYSRATGAQALLVLQAGRTLHESYARDGGPGEAASVMSLTKNLAVLAVLAARADGLLELDEPASRTLGEWRKAPRKRDITIRQLLAQTSGLAPAYNAIYRRNVREKSKPALQAAAVAPPGDRFDYGPANYEVLAEILRRKLAPRRETPLGYLRRRVLNPLGVRAHEWRADRSGEPFFSAGARLTAREVARIGELFRTRGRFGLIQLLPAGAFEGVFPGSPANPMYGLGFWLNLTAPATELDVEATLGVDRSPAAWRASTLANAAPRDLVAMIGSGGQRCYVVPSQRLVIVRFGTGSRFRDAEFLRRLFR